MGEKIEANYDELRTISQKFKAEEGEISQLLNTTRNKVEGLHGSGWIGRGSDTFFNEMNSLILPSLGRLANALMDASEATDKIIQQFQSAEEESRSYFKAL